MIDITTQADPELPPELCSICNEKPLAYKKWRMCRSCYGKLYNNGKLAKCPTYKFEYKPKTKKVSDGCIIDMLNEGFTTATIAKTCNMSRQAIHQRIDKNLYHFKTMHHRHYEIIFLYKIGFTPLEINQLLTQPISNNIVYIVLKKYKVKKRQFETDSQLIRYYCNKNKKPNEIATILNKPPQKIYSSLNNYKNYTPSYKRDKNKHKFEINFLIRLGFTKKEIHELTKVSDCQIAILAEQKLKPFLLKKYLTFLKRYVIDNNK